MLIFRYRRKHFSVIVPKVNSNRIRLITKPFLNENRIRKPNPGDRMLRLTFSFRDCNGIKYYIIELNKRIVLLGTNAILSSLILPRARAANIFESNVIRL